MPRSKKELEQAWKELATGCVREDGSVDVQGLVDILHENFSTEEVEVILVEVGGALARPSFNRLISRFR